MASNKCQRRSYLPNGDVSDSSSPDWLAAVDCCQLELAGDGWAGGGGHDVRFVVVVSLLIADNPILTLLKDYAITIINYFIL